MGNYSMPRYFQNMPVIGKAARANAANVEELRAIEDDIHKHIVDGLNNGTSDEDMNKKGRLTAMQRISLLVYKHKSNSQSFCRCRRYRSWYW